MGGKKVFVNNGAGNSLGVNLENLVHLLLVKGESWFVTVKFEGLVEKQILDSVFFCMNERGW